MALGTLQIQAQEQRRDGPRRSRRLGDARVRPDQRIEQPLRMLFQISFDVDDRFDNLVPRLIRVELIGNPNAEIASGFDRLITAVAFGGQLSRRDPVAPNAAKLFAEVLVRQQLVDQLLSLVLPRTPLLARPWELVP